MSKTLEWRLLKLEKPVSVTENITKPKFLNEGFFKEVTQLFLKQEQKEIKLVKTKVPLQHTEFHSFARVLRPKIHC